MVLYYFDIECILPIVSQKSAQGHSTFTSLPMREVGALSSVSTFNHEKSAHVWCVIKSEHVVEMTTVDLEKQL